MGCGMCALIGYGGTPGGAGVLTYLNAAFANLPSVKYSFSKWVIGKNLHSGRVSQRFKQEPPGFISGGCSSSISSLVHTRELMGHSDVVVWQGDLRSWGLTGFVGASSRTLAQMQQQILGEDNKGQATEN
jgi:hypothetical protein